jgi:hypothetical protein
MFNWLYPFSSSQAQAKEEDQQGSQGSQQIQQGLSSGAVAAQQNQWVGQAGTLANTTNPYIGWYNANQAPTVWTSYPGINMNTHSLPNGKWVTEKEYNEWFGEQVERYLAKKHQKAFDNKMDRLVGNE